MEMKKAIEMYLTHEEDIRRIAETRFAKLACGRESVTFALENYEPFDEQIIRSIAEESGDFVVTKKGTTLTVTLRQGWNVEAERAKYVAEKAEKDKVKK
jgi:hypothetical protein